ncbi:MAG: hypothetical protein ACO390_00990 [bacterium]
MIIQLLRELDRQGAIAQLSPASRVRRGVHLFGMHPFRGSVAALIERKCKRFFHAEPSV